MLKNVKYTTGRYQFAKDVELYPGDTRWISILSV